MSSKNDLIIDKLITIDDTGMPVAPNVKQLLDKDVRTLYTRDKTPDKSKYIAECIVIYYLGDPKSPAKQIGLSDKEALAMAIEVAGLPNNYLPDALVLNLIKKYYKQNITEAGVTVEVILQSIHNVQKAIKNINTLLNEKLDTPMNIEDTAQVITLIDSVQKKAGELPNIIKKLNEAKEELMYEKETQKSRGGGSVSSSMIANDN